MKKIQYTNNDLPFPAQGRAQDLFGTNCVLDEEVQEIWKVVWPALAGVLDNPEKLAAIVGVVRAYSTAPASVSAHTKFSCQASTLCSSWRSAIGKYAVTVINSKMTSEEPAQLCTEAGRKDYVAELIDKTTFPFLYRDPQNEVCLHVSSYIDPLKHAVLQGARGIFQSTPILNVFAYHLGQTSNSCIDYGNPAGGLGLCTAAVRSSLVKP